MPAASLRDPPHRSLWWLLAIVIVVAVLASVAAWVDYQAQLDAARTAAMARLEPITALTLRQLAEWRQDRQRDAALLGGNPYFNEAYAAWVKDAQPEQTDKIRTSLLVANSNDTYSNILLLDANGKERLRLYAERPAPRCLANETLVSAVLSTGKVKFSDLHRCAPEDPPQLVIGAPLHVTRAGGVGQAGVLLLFADVANTLYPLLQSWPITTKSAETLLVEREGNEVVFLNELRHVAGAALVLRRPISDTSLPATAAVLGREGSLEGNDYRGIQVLADVGTVPNSLWRVVSKMDLAEVYAPVTDGIGIFVGGVVAFTVLAVLLLSTLFLAQRQNVYRQLYAVEQQRTAALQRFEALIQSAGDAILLMDATGRIREANPKASTMYGYTLSELLGLQWADLSAEPIAEQATGDRSAPSSSASSYESTHRRQDGAPLPVEITVTTLQLDEAPYTQAIVRDITQRQAAEVALQRSEERLRLLLTNLPIGIVVHAPDTAILFANATAARLLGLRPEELGGKTVVDPSWQFVRQNGDTMPRAEFPVVRALHEPGGVHDYLMGIQRGVADTAWVLVDVLPEYERGALQQLVVTIADISERKHAEDEQARLFGELRTKNEELESLVYVASHDLRSPLVNIQGFGQWLQAAITELTAILAGADLPEAVRASIAPILDDRMPTALHFIQSSSAKMDTLIAGILRLSRLGRAELNPTRIEMDRLLATVLSTLSYQIEEIKATVTVETLPACYADNNQINQLFSNLLDNAIKYRDPARPLVITVSGQRNANQVVYTVADNGIGIGQSQQEKIWELFYRLDPRGSVAGEGLGLALCRRIVERNKGHIKLDSTQGAGSRFYVELPAAPA